MPECNYFKELQLDIEATSEDVRSAYKKLAKQWHPDKNKAEGAEEKFKQILAAYTHLQSDDRRETHAREIKRQKEAAANPKPKPPPQPPPTQQTSTPPQPQTSTSNTQTNSGTRPKSAKTRNSQPGAGTKQQKDWWESFRKKNSNTSSQKPSTPEPPPSRTGTKAKRTKSRPQMRNNMYDFMNSFMNFDNDPFDEFIFDIFMVAPDRPPPRQKTTTDPFGNKLPRNVDNNIYDWKTATKNPGAMPDYQEYLDNETEFACHYCGLMMDMEMLRKHEPRCQRLGGKKKPQTYEFSEEEINGAYGGGTSFTAKPNKPSTSAARKIKCKWCGGSFSKTVAADHIIECQKENGTHVYSPRTRQKPEWNNNFTDTQFDDPEPLYSERPRSARINVDNFGPFARVKPKACLSCKVKYGLSAPQFCNH